MIFEFRPAKRVAETVLLGLVGPSGSGKTYSALLVATGLCAPGARIVVIDTEGHHGRALQYAPPGDNTFDFDHLKLSPPYKAERYQKAFEAAEKQAGPGGVVIIDSMSAEHESEGGALDEHHERTSGDAKLNMVAWAHIRPYQHALCRALTNSRCHVICCFRGEDKIKLVGNKPTPVGWQAIGWKRWPYEMQACVLLSHERKGVPIVDGFEWGKIPVNLSGLIPTDRPLSADVGKRLAKWAVAGEKAPDSSPTRPDTSADTAAGRKLYVAIRDAADLGELGQLEHENAALIKRLDEKARTAIAGLFKQRLAELSAPAAERSMAEELDDLDDPEIAAGAADLQRQWASDQTGD